MKLLSPLDQMFVRMESARTPMHIGALAIFKLPDDAEEDFVRNLYAAFTELAFLPFPYDSVLSSLPLADAVSWRQVEPDPAYHVRRNALPSPGSDADLGRLVERLHSQPLDMSKPLWEAYVIEGLADRRFAFYFKAHHCATDGLGAVETIKAWLSTDPDALPTVGLEEPEAGTASLWQKLMIMPGRATSGVVATVEVLAKLVDMTTGAHSTVRAALNTPKSIFNQRLTPHRRVAFEALDLPTLKAVAKATGTTVNDVVLGALGTSVRRYLLEQDALPKASLNASVPVGFEREEQTINAASGFVCTLATDTDDPLERLHRISGGTARGKGDIDKLSKGAAEYYTLIGLLPLAFAQKSGALQKLPPVFNFTVSNVLLSKERLYLLGAELELIAPMSFLVDGYGINVTLVGYTDTVTLGFVGCRDTIPHLQRLAAYTGQALKELARLTA